MKQERSSYYRGAPPAMRFPVRPAPTTGDRTHVVFNLVGFLAGIGAAVYAYVETTSIALPVFVFLVTSMFVGRGLGDVVTDPHKVRRFVYFALLPASCTAVLYVTYVWWERMWLAVILGLFVGMVIWNLLSLLFFRQIHVEEQHDSERRRIAAGMTTG